MKLALKTTKLKHLNKQHQQLDKANTPRVGGGYTTMPWTAWCEELSKGPDCRA
ncbi:hypothetical protein [Pseudoalteromonas sp. OOF1S-7]|uniref:hypothetical protein n=1 Tax=Pseudoalteromonas sp. OOF1S-7 TaxID=2917757 RepID=UPI001EF67F50|nr:hypothetical protein [Pseudoalteromonas sp. OOF1S-7]MCG7533761.1 hypothetical protein [Pseudoalteromonas sp. OOF1S-7]